MYKICVPVTGSTLTEFLNNLQQVQTQHDFVDLRLNCIQDLTLEGLVTIKKSLLVKAIANCRFDLDGEIKLKLAIIGKCLELGFDYVDIELATVKQFCLPVKNPKNKPKKKHNQTLQATDSTKLDLNQKSPNTKLIFSYYNSKATDNYRFLRQIQDQMRGFGCDIQKFSCQVHTNYDLIILTRLLVSKTQSEELIVLGLGELGSFMTTNGLLLGNYLTFAGLDKIESTASEQTTVQKIKTVLQ